jgi:hypothetical protein
VRLGGLVPEGLSDLSRRDDRTQPGVLTPGYQCAERPALKGRKIVAVERKLESELRSQINETKNNLE